MDRGAVVLFTSPDRARLSVSSGRRGEQHEAGRSGQTREL